MDLFSEINADGTAVMLVTHDAQVAARTERIMFMRDGKVVGELKPNRYGWQGQESYAENAGNRNINRYPFKPQDYRPWLANV